MKRLDRRNFSISFGLLGWVATTDYLLCQNAILINQVNPKANAADGLKIVAEYVITAEWPVTVDADVDLHVVVPDGEYGTDVYYSFREFKGVSLDHDCRGFSDTHHRLVDGSEAVDLTAKEMTTIRGIVPGHYDAGVHLYQFHQDGDPVPSSFRGCNVKTHVEVVQLNPKTKIVFASDLVLTHVKQCLNFVSFDLDKSGGITFTDLPLAPITDHVFAKGDSD